MAKRIKTLFLCESCGNEFSTWYGQCPECKEWNTLKEFKVDETFRSSSPSLGPTVVASVLKDIAKSDYSRITSGIGELDRVLGGGIMPASIVLVGGEPGIGKSTLLLQVAALVKKSLYVSGEESLSQIKERADRLKISAQELKLLAHGDLEEIEKLVLKDRPKLIIIDSIQTVFLPSIPSTIGSMVQVRECGMFLQRLAKTSGIPIFIVGHVTKEGTVAGPRTLEHLVDVVLYFEGDRYHDMRLLRGVKNRFGATNEVGIFSIQEQGLVELKNPSEAFLKEYSQAPGSTITAMIEGTRPLLIEVQALVTPTHFGYPKRMASGFDLNRLNLLTAVISKATKVNLSNSDIYLNVVGGIKVTEPAADLAVCAAIISSFFNRPIPAKLCLFGEVGLSGEIRKVKRQLDREKEAKTLGFEPLQGTRNLAELVGRITV